MSKYISLLPILALVLSAAHPNPIELKIGVGTLVNRPQSIAQKYTGVVKQVDDIAEQITVRIEDKAGNGSGVIIAKTGNTYSVVTAAHVVKGKEGYSIITPTQERITLKPEQVNIINKDLDIAIVKFISNQNYRIAELANYQFKDKEWIFLAGFPGRDVTRRRYLSIGGIRDRETTEFAVKDRASLSNGNNLIYSNLSLPGMSGGALLDRQGRLVGINTGAENEQIITREDRQEEINFGYARGISTATISGVLSQGQPKLQLKLTTTLPSELTDPQIKEIKQNQLSALSVPSRNSNPKEWLDYGNLLWRSQEPKQAIAAFDRAIAILRSDAARLDREQLKLAYFGKGLALAEQIDTKGTVAAFQAATKIDPEFVQAWRYQGMYLQYFLNRDAEALSSFQKAIELDPNNFVLHVERGGILLILKRYPEAIAAYNRAIEIQPNHLWAYHNRGITYAALKQYPQAIVNYNQAIKINPQYASAYYNRGNTYKTLKKYQLAIADYSRAIEFDPQSAFAYGNRGFVYAILKQSQLALADYNRSINIQLQTRIYANSLNSQDGVAVDYNNRGVLYEELKDYQKAIADYSQAIKISPQFAVAYTNRGNVYKQLKAYQPALADYTQVIKLQPQDTDYEIESKLDRQQTRAVDYANRGLIYTELKQYPQALADFNKSIELNPKYLIAYYNRGYLYKELQQYPQALADFNKSIALNPQAPDAYGNRGHLYFKLSQYPQAIADFDRAIKLNPQDARFYNSRGVIYSIQKEYQKAFADYSKAIALNPQKANTYQNRANVYLELKQYDKAKADLEKAAQLYQQQENKPGYQAVLGMLQELTQFTK